MNYRHAFHAGNHADVLKHVVLLALLEALMRKPTPLFVLDTHAGAGDYDLASENALKTGEAAAGITKLITSGVARSRKLPPAFQADDETPLPLAAPVLAAYVGAIAAHRERWGVSHYPGSPALINAALREQDHMACCELEDAAAAALRRMFGRDARVAVHQRDGYGAIKALLPPVQKRGLVLIDPPYEAQLTEFDAIRTGLKIGLERWPQGVFAVWYPIKLARALQPFLRALSLLPSQGVLDVRVLVRPATSPISLNGSGVAIVNPPWQIEQELAPALAGIAKTLGEAGHGVAELRWLREPA